MRQPGGLRFWGILFGVLVFGLGLYFRLWNIEHLFSIIHDYDEGVYDLAARFITEGYVPYRDFLFVHPPVHIYALAGLYKLFGYSFFTGRYLSVAASMGSAALLYFAGRKLYSSPRAGLVAAAFMLLETQMVYLGRRTVQESLGLVLVSGAVLFTAYYVSGGRRRLLIPAGALLGVAVAVKYIMTPAAFGIVLGLAALSLPKETWQKLRFVGRPVFLAVAGSVSFACYSILLLVKWTGLASLPVPFTDAMPPGIQAWLVTIWLVAVPFLVALLVLVPRERQRIDPAAVRGFVASRDLWLVGGCIVAGFFIVTAYFWTQMPGEFLRQTVLLQGERPTTEFPSLFAFIRAFGIGAYLGFLRVSMLPVLFIIPAIVLLLNRSEFTRRECFLAVSLAGGLLLCQWLFHLPRYYASLYPLLFLGIAWLVPPLDAGPLSGRSKAGLAFVSAALVASASVSIVLLHNYTAYDVLWAEYVTEEEDVYRETIDYLRDADANKVYVTSPVYVTITDDLESTLQFDTFANLWLAQIPPDEFIEQLRAEGVDYVGIDRWTRDWQPPYTEALDALVTEVRLNSELVETIRPGSVNRVEIYRLLDTPPVIANGTFEFWQTEEGQAHPIGWSPVIIADQDDEALLHAITLEGGTAVRLAVYENGAPGSTEGTHAGILQRIPFPRTGVTVRVAPGINTVSLGAEPVGPAIHFLDGEGHSVIVGFSDQVDEEEVSPCPECGHVAVILPAPLYELSEHSLDVARYWRMGGWDVPDEIGLLAVLSSTSEHPGYFTFIVERIVTEEPG